MWSCTWSNKRVKSCYCARTRLHTDQDDLSRGQPVQYMKEKVLIHRAQPTPTYTTHTVTCQPSRACRPRARYPLPALQRAGPLRPTAAGEELLYKTYFARG